MFVRCTALSRIAAPLLTAAVLSSSCGASGRADSTSVDLMLGHAAGRDAAPGASGGTTFLTSDGSTVTLTRGYVTVSSIELVPCPPSAARRLLRALSPVGVARAHGVAEGPRFARPHVHDVLAPEDERQHLGTVKPLPGRYCTARLELGPAPDGERAAAIGMVGLTLDVQGTVAPSGGGAEVPFHVQSAAPAAVDVSLGELHLDRDQVASASFTFTYGAWLDGVELGAGDPAAAALAQVVASLSAAAGGAPASR